MADASQLFERLNAQFGSNLELSEDGQAIYCPKDSIVKLLQVLGESQKYTFLTDLTAVENAEDLEVVYHVMMMENADLLRLKVKLAKDSLRIPSITSLWASADVLEREVFDLFGIIFDGHDNLTRILCPDDFVGHPLRKDFKLDIISRF